MRIVVGSVLVAGGLALIAAESGLFSVLSNQVHVGRQEQGFYLLPTNQLLHPWGEQAAIKGRPVDLAFDSRKHLLAVLNARSVMLLDGASGAQMAAIKSHGTSYTGIAFRPGDRELWASEASEDGPDSLLIVTLSELGAMVKAQRLSLKPHPLPAGIAFSSDGKTAFVAFNRTNTLAVFDAETRQLKREVPVGMAPFGVAVSKDAGVRDEPRRAAADAIGYCRAQQRLDDRDRQDNGFIGFGHAHGNQHAMIFRRARWRLAWRHRESRLVPMKRRSPWPMRIRIRFPWWMRGH